MKLLMVLLVTGLLTGCGANSVENQIMTAKQNAGYLSEEEPSQLDYHIMNGLEWGDIVGFTDEMVVYSGMLSTAIEVDEYGCSDDEELRGGYCINMDYLQQDYELRREWLDSSEGEDLQVYIELEDLYTDKPVGVYNGKDVIFYK